VPHSALDVRRETQAENINGLLPQAGWARFAVDCFFLRGFSAIASALK
jgi:hypothetical protein